MLGQRLITPQNKFGRMLASDCRAEVTVIVTTVSPFHSRLPRVLGGLDTRPALLEDRHLPRQSSRKTVSVAGTKARHRMQTQLALDHSARQVDLEGWLGFCVPHIPSVPAFWTQPILWCIPLLACMKDKDLYG